MRRAAGYTASDTYNVLTANASNGVSGTFSGISVASGSFGDLVPYLTYPNGKSRPVGFDCGHRVERNKHL